jgi:hypothetical protein
MFEGISFGQENVVKEVQFRDGPHDVLPYIISMITAAGIDTHAVTYEEALDLVGEATTRRFLNGKLSSMISDHRKNYG